MSYQGRKNSPFRIFVLLVFLIGTLLFLLYEFGLIGEAILVEKEIKVDKSTEQPTVLYLKQTIEQPPKPKLSLMDTLLIELEESLDAANTNKNYGKVLTTDGRCPITDNVHTCPPGNRTGCIQKSMSRDVKHRLEDLMNNKNLRIAPHYRELLQDLEKHVEGRYRVVVVSAVSSGYYFQSQAMLKVLHDIYFALIPRIKVVVYDLGLTAKEHEEYQKLCRCQLIRFPFEKLPPFCRSLKCFCWKPFVIRAHLGNGDMVMWMDASVRYNYYNPQRFLDILRRTQMYGLQLHGGKRDKQPKLPMYGFPQTFHHFGFTPCAFKDYPNAASNWAMYRSTPLIEHAVLDPWVSCGLNQTCACPDLPVGSSSQSLLRQGSQASQSIILSRLWMGRYYTVTSVPNDMKIKKDNKLNYFKEIDSSKDRKGMFNELIFH